MNEWIKEKIKKEKRKKEQTGDYKKEFEEVRKKLLEEEKSVCIPERIRRLLYENEKLRRTFLAVIKYHPAMMHEITQYTGYYKQSCYNFLFHLMRLGLIDRKFVNEISNPETEVEKEILQKFNRFVERMPENTQRYFASKTSMFYVTEFGKKFALWAYLKQKEVETEPEDKKEFEE